MSNCTERSADGCQVATAWRRRLKVEEDDPEIDDVFEGVEDDYYVDPEMDAGEIGFEAGCDDWQEEDSVWMPLLGGLIERVGIPMVVILYEAAWLYLVKQQSVNPMVAGNGLGVLLKVFILVQCWMRGKDFWLIFVGAFLVPYGEGLDYIPTFLFSLTALVVKSRDWIIKHRRAFRIGEYNLIDMALRFSQTEDQGQGLKNDLRAIRSKDEFNYVRAFTVAEERKGPGVVSRSYYKLLEAVRGVEGLLQDFTVADIGAGRGSWTQLCVNTLKAKMVHAYSFWKEHHEQWEAGDRCVTLHKGDLTSPDLIVEKVDMFVFDAGESRDDYVKEGERHLGLLHALDKWFDKNPEAHFFIKIMAPTHPGIILKLEEWHAKAGRGSLWRAAASRNSSTELYFCSWKASRMKIGDQAQVEMRKIREKVAIGKANFRSGVKQGPTTFGSGLEMSKVIWEPTHHNHQPNLPEYNMQLSMEEMYGFAKRQKPGNYTKFLKELFWYDDVQKQTPLMRINHIVGALIGVAAGALPSFLSWKTTDTSSFATFMMVLNKIDSAPVENHHHYGRMGKSLNAISKWIRSHGGSLHRLSDAEIEASFNRKGAMGFQEERLGYSNLGEFFDNGPWRERSNEFMQSLRDGKPVRAVFNSMGKIERKKTAHRRKASRLVWFLPASSRLRELETLGSLMKLMHLLPFSVSGSPLFDYGELLNERWKEGWRGVADDVAAWDTHVSMGDLKMECAFLQSLCDDPVLKDDIWYLYRLYANKHVVLSRSVNGQGQRALYKLRGMRGSGEIVTYGMNTILNAAVIFARAGLAEGIKEEDQEEWVMKKMREMLKKDSTFEMLVSGDDAVVMGPRENMVRFANQHQFMREIGKPRKDIPDGDPSPMTSSIEETEFCSHRFSEVEFRNKSGELTHYRYMPTRDTAQIFAKACIMLKSAKDTTTIEAWARAQGFSMIVSYPHLMDCRYLAAGLLSATRMNISLESMAHSARIREEPWLAGGLAIEVINRCYGSISKFPIPFEIYDLRQIRLMNRATDGIPFGRARQNWKRNLWETVLTVRAMLKEHHKEVLWDNSFDQLLEAVQRNVEMPARDLIVTRSIHAEKLWYMLVKDQAIKEVVEEVVEDDVFEPP